MWENNRTRMIIRNILIFILLACVVAGLGYSYLKVRKQIAEEDAQLTAANQDQRQELSAARQENLELVQQEYEKDMQAVAKYVPGIVCWGDSLTAGSSGNVSYPDTLRKYLNTYLCDIYDFSAGFENSSEYTRVKWNEYKFSIPVVNMGSGQEDCATILGRSGVASYVVQSDFEIPAGKEAVKVTFTAPDGRKVLPLTAGSAGVNPVTIGGVEGTLSMVASSIGWQQYEYHFVRSQEGSAVPVTAGTEIVTAAANQYTDYIHIVWMGAYDGYRTADQLVQDVKLLLSRQTANTDRYLVIGPCAYNGSWMQEFTYTLDNIDSAMMQAFGNHYVNVRKYLIEDGLRDAGLTATKEDSTKGAVPASFRSNAAGADLNGVAYKLIGKLVYERMDRLGYFSEIRAELNLDKTTQNILKNDPNYFERLLKAN